MTPDEARELLAAVEELWPTGRSSPAWTAAERRQWHDLLAAHPRDVVDEALDVVRRSRPAERARFRPDAVEVAGAAAAVADRRQPRGPAPVRSADPRDREPRDGGGAPVAPVAAAQAALRQCRDRLAPCDPETDAEEARHQ